MNKNKCKNRNGNTNDELIKKIIKYILFAFITGVAVRYIPKCMTSNEEILKISAVSAISFAILDMYSPSIQIYS